MCAKVLWQKMVGTMRDQEKATVIKTERSRVRMGSSITGEGDRAGHAEFHG